MLRRWKADVCHMKGTDTFKVAIRPAIVTTHKADNGAFSSRSNRPIADFYDRYCAEGLWHIDGNKAFLEPAVVAVKVFSDSWEGVTCRKLQSHRWWQSFFSRTSICGTLRHSQLRRSCCRKPLSHRRQKALAEPPVVCPRASCRLLAGVT